jgi:hypothetical protein
MRVLCETLESPARDSPAVGVADGFPYPWGIGSNTYLRFPLVP